VVDDECSSTREPWREVEGMARQEEWQKAVCTDKHGGTLPVWRWAAFPRPREPR